MAQRTALLIAVGDTPQARRFPSLQETVTADLHILEAALEGSGYRVEPLRNPTRNKITSRIAAVSRDAAPGSTLLVYFTGHGVRIGDQDYLLPADALAPDSDSPENWQQDHIRESLVEADISRYLTHCTAGTVLWVIDACRSPQYGGDGRPTAFGSSITKGAPHSGFAVLTGCAAGERCDHAEGGSFFTVGLAHAFDPLTEATTVENVFNVARQHTRQLSRQRTGTSQEAQIRYGTELQEKTRTTIVAEGRRLLESWRNVVLTSALWDRVPAPQAGSISHFQACLTELVTNTAREVHRAQERLPDPWADDEFPVRVLRDRLPELLPEDATLSGLEVTALIAGVFLYEAAWAGRLSRAAELEPHTVGGDSGAEGDPETPEGLGDDHERRHYEQIVEHHPDIAERLVPRPGRTPHPTDERNALVLWLVHRWIAERFETDGQPIPAVLSAGIAARLLGAEPPTETEPLIGRAAELSGALRTVALGLAPGGPPEGPGQHRAGITPYPLPGALQSQKLRARPLTELLRLARLLAFDTRTLPDVIAEHLAVVDPVLPREVITVLRHADWSTDTEDDAPAARVLHLDAVCPHPAIHDALRTIVEEADDLGHALRETAAGLPEPEAKLLKGLPPRVTDRGLRAAEGAQGERAYDVPLLRFSLAQTEVRRLLMGEKLYGGRPELAVRELYQNAMDACRYRAMRTRYLQGTGRGPGPWSGHIRFTSGEDSRGRYMECQDNGVGMTVDQLKNTFTRAGRRFEQSRGFRREQARWLRHDKSLRLYPNSRFGIGVFSYFMLAEAMTITTRPVDEDGRPARKALRVDVSGSGSLFRIQEDDEREGAALPEGGTRVRLYLRDGVDGNGTLCGEVLRELVLVAEFELVVRDRSGRETVWAAGLLDVREWHAGTEPKRSVEAVPGVLWWVAGSGAILCDGIATDKQPFGYVLNLTGPHAGELSVDRTTLEGHDRRWARQMWQRGAPVLAKWPYLWFNWLHSLEQEDLTAATTIWQRWRGKSIQLRRFGLRAVNLDQVGWFSMDRSVEERDAPDRRSISHGIEPWRHTALNITTSAVTTSTALAAEPLSLVGYPVPEPGWSRCVYDGAEIWPAVIDIAHDQGITVAEVLRRKRALRIAHPDLAPPAVREGDLAWIPDATDNMITTAVMNVLRHPDKRRHGRISPRSLVRASNESQLPLGRLSSVWARYVPLGAPELDAPAHHQDHICDHDETAMLMRYDGEELQPTVEPWDVLSMAGTWDVSVAEAHRRFVRFTWLGWSVPDLGLIERWADIDDDLLRLLIHHTVRDDHGRPTLTWGATVEYARIHECPLHAAEEFLSKAADVLGLTLHHRYRGRPGGRDLAPTRKTADFTWLLGKEWPPAAGFNLHDPDDFKGDLTHEKLADIVDELRRFGWDIPDVVPLLRAWEELSPLSKYAFASPVYGNQHAYPMQPTSAVLFTGGSELRLELAALYDTARDEVERLGLDPGFLPPPLPEELAGYQPTWDEVLALMDRDEDKNDRSHSWAAPPRWTHLTPSRLIRYARTRHITAREAFALLAPLRAIGALVPALPPMVMAALPDTVPGRHDLLALSREFRVSGEGSALVPLDLVSIAGRLGETVTDTWNRITPYLPLEPVPPEPGTLAHVPDVIPLWQDLAILSEGLNGLLPAVHGRVTDRWLAHAADGVGESPTWVRERLSRYAGLFDLELPPAPAFAREPSGNEATPAPPAEDHP